MLNRISFFLFSLVKRRLRSYIPSGIDWACCGSLYVLSLQNAEERKQMLFQRAKDFSSYYIQITQTMQVIIKRYSLDIYLWTFKLPFFAKWRLCHWATAVENTKGPVLDLSNTVNNNSCMHFRITSFWIMLLPICNTLGVTKLRNTSCIWALNTHGHFLSCKTSIPVLSLHMSLFCFLL